MKIIALDPGGTTGYAIWGEPGGQLEQPNHHLDLWNLLAAINPDVIVYEAFNYQIRRNQGTDMPGVHLISREYIGVATLFHQMSPNANKIVKQQPSIIGLAWLKDPALKKLGLHTAGEPHRNDATRHLLYYMVTALGRQDLLEPLKG